MAIDTTGEPKGSAEIQERPSTDDMPDGGDDAQHGGVPPASEQSKGGPPGDGRLDSEIAHAETARDADKAKGGRTVGGVTSGENAATE